MGGIVAFNSGGEKLNARTPRAASAKASLGDRFKLMFPGPARSLLGVVLDQLAQLLRDRVDRVPGDIAQLEACLVACRQDHDPGHEGGDQHQQHQGKHRAHEAAEPRALGLGRRRGLVRGLGSPGGPFSVCQARQRSSQRWVRSVEWAV